jgi:hypothetical protein
MRQQEANPAAGKVDQLGALEAKRLGVEHLAAGVRRAGKTLPGSAVDWAARVKVRR